MPLPIKASLRWQSPFFSLPPVATTPAAIPDLDDEDDGDDGVDTDDGDGV